MSYTFTITNANPFVFTATVVNSNLAVSVSTASVTASVINPGFTATLFTSVVNVDKNNDTVNVSSPVANFTGTIIDQTIVVSSPYGLVDVTIAPVNNTVTVNQTPEPVSIEYNPTIVRHLFDGQPIYTTSTVQFAGLTLGTTSTFTFPANDGLSGQFLTTDGNGFMYWSTATGGGGGLAFWSLNSDLLTNGFRIKSGSGLVPLEINAGGGQLDLGVNSTKLYHTGTNRSIEINAFTEEITLNNTRASLTVGPNQIEVLTDNFDVFTVAGAAVNKVMTVSGLLRAQLLEVPTITTGNLLTDSSYIDVPPLRFPDGTVLASATTGTFFYTTGTISLEGDLYTNDFAIRGNGGNGTLTLRQGNNQVLLVGNGSDSDYLKIKRNNIDNTDDSITIDNQGITLEVGAGSSYINFSRLKDDDSRLTTAVDRFAVTANTASFTTVNPVSFSSGIRFGDGTVQTTAATGGGGTGSGVTSITATGTVSVSTSTGDVIISGNGLSEISNIDSYLPITASGSNRFINLNVNAVLNRIEAGTGTTIYRNLEDKTITIAAVPTFAPILTSDLITDGYNIDAGFSQQLNIKGGESNFLGNQTFSQVYFPVNQPLNLFSSYGITLDTPDDKTVNINSPFTVSHRDGASRISTNAVGETRLNDGTIAVTATNRILLQNSIITPSQVQLKATSAGVVGVTVTATGVTLAGDIKLSSTNRVRVGQDLYNSRLGVESITNFNGTGPFTASQGVQFPDLTVQRTAYQGYLNFGQIAAPATNPQDFMLQLQAVDFGTVGNPGTLAYDAGTI